MILSVNNLYLGYENKKIIKKLSFSLETGDFLCVVGPNGSGKSTLIKGLLGLISPLKGNIKYNNLKRNFIGYMPQETKVDSNFPATVYEIVLSGCLNKLGLRPFYNNDLKDIANKNMKLLNIYNLKDKSFCDLSGGQRQKVLLARALCATNKLLVLDEPLNNLDQKSKKELYVLLNKINKEEHITIIMITHDLDSNNLIGNKVLALGESYFFGSRDSYIGGLNND